MRIVLVTGFLLLSSFIYASPDQVLDKIYINGSSSFYDLFRENVRYPQVKAMGVALLEWKIEKGKIIDVSFPNGVDKMIEQEVKRVLFMTKGNWLNVDSTITFILPIQFKNNKHDYFVDKCPDHFLNELVVVKILREDYKFVNDGDLVSKINNALKDRKFEDALPFLNEIIKRNPVNKQMREIRAMVLNELKKHDEACVDVQFIENYLLESSSSKCT